jgi:GH35 family endo-1,4-beta-xylanase
MLKEAGVTWLRLFPEWQSTEPRKGEFNWTGADRIVADARKNNIRLVGWMGYFAPWATTDGSTRTAPIKNINDWGDYATALVSRYKDSIKHWEIYNEFNGSFSKSSDKPRDYVAMVVAASKAIKSVDPQAMIGISCANFDLGFFDGVIKAIQAANPTTSSSRKCA